MADDNVVSMSDHKDVSKVNREKLEFEAKILDAAVKISAVDKTAANLIVDAEPQCGVSTITPAMAAYLFVETNKHNRDFSLSKAHDYAEQMRKGYWKLTHQGLAWYPDRKLSDGQHRLAATFLSSTSQQFAIFRRFDPDALEAIDTAKRRTAGEAFGITGMVNKNDAKIAGSIVEAIMKYEALRLHAKRITPSIYEQKDWALEHKQQLEQALALTNKLVKGDPVLTKPELGSFALGMLIGGYSVTMIETFLGDIMESLGRYPESPAIDLHKQFLKSKERSAIKGKLSKEEKMALAFKGAAIYALKQSTGGLRWKAGRDPLPAPTPPEPMQAAG